MEIDQIARQPFLGIWWIITFSICFLFLRYFPGYISYIKRSVVLLIVLCIVSGFLFIIPNFSNSYMQQHFLNGAHNLKFGLYNLKDLHSGFYGPFAYWAFAWWNSDLISSISIAKSLVFLFFPVNAVLLIKLMPNTSKYIKLSIIFILIAQAYYLYLGVHQFIVFFATLIYIFGYQRVRDGYHKDSNPLGIASIFIVSFASVSLFLLKPHLIVYSFLSLPLFINYFKKNKTTFNFRFNYKNLLLFAFLLVSFLYLITSLLDFNLKNYIQFFLIPAGHGIFAGYLFGLIFVNILLISLLSRIRIKLGENNIKNIFYIIPVFLVSLPLIYASSKRGSDVSHVLPLWTFIIADIFSSFEEIKKIKTISFSKDILFVKILSIALPLFFLPLTIESYGSTYKWYLKIDSDLIQNNISYIKDKYRCENIFKGKRKIKSCVSFGLGSSAQSLKYTMYFSPLLTNEYNYNLTDVSMIRDKYDSGIKPYYQKILGGNEVAYFVLPKGEEPFSMPLDIIIGDQTEPMFGEEGISFFKSNYNLVESTSIYDIYQSKYLKNSKK